MPRPLPLLPRQRRRKRNRSLKTLAPFGPPAPAPPPPPAALTLVSVDALGVVGAEIEMNLIFNVSGSETLADVSAADPTKWTARYQGQRYVGNVITNVLPDMLFLNMTASGAEAGADELNYANAPSDISDSLGRFLAAFAGFPIS
jgi:hypothetical protein